MSRADVVYKYSGIDFMTHEGTVLTEILNISEITSWQQWTMGKTENRNDTNMTDDGDDDLVLFFISKK